MKFRADFLLILLAPVLLLAAFDCGTDGSGDCEKMFGGPYPNYEDFGEKVLGEKLADFALYGGLELSVSDTHLVTRIGAPVPDIFANSVKENRLYGNGVNQQRYNYVITEDCDILMAVWSESPDLQPILDSSACTGGIDFPIQPSAGLMIDFAAEDPFATPSPAKFSPCWLDPKREKGILDAISKHFMLAQGEQKNAMSTFDHKNSDWGNAKVAYAGEILVDVPSCTYIVTEGSGTYRPSGFFRPKINEVFAIVFPDSSNTRGQRNHVPNCP